MHRAAMRSPIPQSWRAWRPRLLGLALAVALVATLVAGCGDDDGRQRAIAPAPIRNPAQAKSLASSYQPVLVLERDDEFWPIPVATIDALLAGDDRTCLRLRKGAPCERILLDRLPWGSGPAQSFIDYPADNADPEEQSEAMQRALGSSDLGARAQLYFFLTGRRQGKPISLQYWFFYLYNYLPVRFHGHTLFNTGLHEGDFEGMSILLSARSHRPVYVWMPRHNAEGIRYVWHEGALERRDEHPVGYVAHGSHATYSSCGRMFRTQFVLGAPADLPDDTIDCSADDRYQLGPTVPVLNLARARWACWPGHFGYAPGHNELVGAHFANGPQSPLYQQKFDLRRPQPCAGVPAPDGAGAPLGGLADAETAKRLGLAGGRLDGLFRTCYDWFQRPPAGSYMVACDREALDAFFDSGLEDPGPQNLRILGDPQPTGPTVPAVYESTEMRGVDSATIRTDRPARVEVYVAVRDGNRLKSADFDRFELQPQQELRLRRPDDERWLLVDLATGEAVASAPVRATRAAGEPQTPTISSAVREGAEIRLAFSGGTDPDTHLVALAGSSREDLDEGGRPVEAVRGERPGQYVLTIDDPLRQIRFLRVLASRDGAVAGSRPVAVSEGS